MRRKLFRHHLREQAQHAGGDESLARVAVIPRGDEGVSEENPQHLPLGVRAARVFVPDERYSATAMARARSGEDVEGDDAIDPVVTPAEGPTG